MLHITMFSVYHLESVLYRYGFVILIKVRVCTFQLKIRSDFNITCLDRIFFRLTNVSTMYERSTINLIFADNLHVLKSVPTFVSVSNCLIGTN